MGQFLELVLIGLMNRQSLFFGVILFGVTCPDDSGPGGVGVVAGDDVDVHLAHDVANGGNIDFVRLKLSVHELGDLPDGETDRGEVGGV